MEELDNKNLVEAIRKMKEENTKESQSLMLGEMMKSKFLNPTTLKLEPDNDGKINIPSGTQISFYTITSIDKKRFAMAFTEREELNKWIEANIKAGAPENKLSKNVAIMGFMEYADIILNENSGLDGLVINPYNENIVFNKEQIASLREQKINKEQYGMTRNIIQKDEEIALKKLGSEEYPSELITSIVEHMKNKEEIDSAWILKMKKKEKESFLLVVDFKGDLNVVLGEIGRIAKPFLHGEIKSLDMVPLNSKLGKVAIEYGDKIYDKNGIQIFNKTQKIEKSEVVENAIEYVKEFFENIHDGHDVYHTLRVYNLAEKIAIEEGADIEIVRLSALLHDVDDRKIVQRQKEPFENAKKFLKAHKIDNETIEKICNIISQISFKGDDSKTPDTLEGKVVQDADRLDAIGAIGIARVFSYHGAHGLQIYNPEISYKEHMNEEEYYSNKPTAINHFYEKLLKLKGLMNTNTAKKIAESRNKIMEDYLKEFYSEWDGLK